MGDAVGDGEAGVGVVEGAVPAAAVDGVGNGDAVPAADGDAGGAAPSADAVPAGYGNGDAAPSADAVLAVDVVPAEDVVPVVDGDGDAVPAAGAEQQLLWCSLLLLMTMMMLLLMLLHSEWASQG